MNSAKKLKNSKTSSPCSIDLIKLNEILRANNKTEIKLDNHQSIPGEYLQAQCASSLLDLLLVDLSANLDLIQDILDAQIIHVNEIKNFFNQTLLYFATESNDQVVCRLLVSKYGADCLLEDRYRQTPFLLSIRTKQFDLFELFIDNINQQIDQAHTNKHVLNAAYYASCTDNLEILSYLFDKFELTTNQLVSQICFCKSYDLNPIHVACFKGYSRIVEFFLNHISPGTNKSYYLNSSLNEFRSSTALEEAFKGFLMLEFNNELELLPGVYASNHRLAKSIASRQEKKKGYVRIINLLIENEAKFSPNFLIKNGLVNMLAMVFTGPNRDADFAQFLYCISYLFKFKLVEIFSNNEFEALQLNSSYSESETTETFKLDSSFRSTTSGSASLCSTPSSLNINYFLEKFLYKVYLNCLKVLKDYKYVCLSYYFNIVVNLYLSGQFKFQPGCVEKTFWYLKERNTDLYQDLVGLFKTNVTEDTSSTTTNRLFSLKTICCIRIKESIQNFGITKLDSFNIPGFLKHDIFLNNCSSSPPAVLRHNFYLNKQSNEFVSFLTS